MQDRSKPDTARITTLPRFQGRIAGYLQYALYLVLFTLRFRLGIKDT